MKTKKIFFLTILYIVIPFFSLAQKQIITENRKTVLLINDLLLEMPGNIFVTDNVIIVENPLSGNEFYHVFDKKNYLLGKFCVRGKSNIEFLQPNIFVKNNIATVYDLNANKYVKYSLKDLKITESINRGINHIIPQLESLCPIDDNLFVGIDLFKKKNIITLCNNVDTVCTFGILPIKSDYVNTHLVNSGTLCFNPEKSLLFFFSNKFPYYAKYKFKNGKFELIVSNEYRKYRSKMEDKRITFEYDDLLISNVILTKKYIVQLRRNPDEQKVYMNNQEPGRNYDNLPRNLYLYDYDLNLVRIIRLDTPILRFTGNTDSDIIYMISYVEGLFNVSKIEL